MTRRPPKNPRLVAIAPLWQRHGLTRLMLSRLRDQGIQTVAVGSDDPAMEHLVQECGASYHDHPNTPLGKKLNHVLRRTRDLSPDGVVVLGSDDFVTDRLFAVWKKWLTEGVELMGLLDGYMYDVATDQLGYWPGYISPRDGKTLGSGRCYSRSLLDRMSWQLWDNGRCSGLDASADRRVKRADPKIRTTRMGAIGARHVAIKTDVQITQFPARLPAAAVKIDPSFVDDWLGAGFRERVRGAL